MKKTVKFLLTSILAFTSLGLVSVNIKDVKKGFVESTNDVAGEKINVGKKNAISTNTEEDFVVGKSVRITNAVAQRREETKGTTIRFVAAAKAENLTEGVIGGDLGFHVRYNRSETEVVNKYVAVESVYKSMVAGNTTYTNDKMGDFLVSTGLGEASNPNGYDVFITYSIAEIPSTHISTEFEVQPFFLKTGEETREFAPGTKKANATGYTLKVGNGNAVSLTDDTSSKSDLDTWDAQYKTTITAAAGDVVTFYVDGAKINANINLGMGDNTKNNVVDKENGNFEVRTAIENQDVYLKKYGEWYNVWLAGYDDGGDTPIIPEKGTKVYLVDNANWGAAYAYCWTGANKNAAWPGDAMTKLTSKNASGLDVYEYTIKSAYSNFIFNNNNGSQTADLSITNVTGDNIYYDVANNKWVANADDVKVSEKDCFVRGSMNGWADNDAYCLKANPSNPNERMITLTLTKNAKFKIVYKGNWYGISNVKSECKSLVSGTDNIVIKEAGSYTFYFDTTSKMLYIAKN